MTLRKLTQKNHYSLLVLFFLTVSSCQSSKQPSNSMDGFEPIFDGQSLNAWEGDPAYWRVENGTLVGEVTPSTLLKRNTFIIWRGGITEDFEFKAEYMITEDGNSGINYRSEEVAGVPFALAGYQCDIDGKNRYTGMNYEERKRTTLANTGKIVVLARVPEAGKALSENISQNQWKPAKVTGETGDIDEFKAQIKPNVWNQVHIIVQGNRMRHYVNGNLMSDVTDNDNEHRKLSGLLGVQVHVGPPMRIAYRNMMIKHL
ncbi:3-keto-disaccharide hydrolase [Lunatibacter salilacus]|uniref:3-keto-disaccharide hydrolase n=1 Tax=Lunatibacter salilacus TaxID=2483804 RepID=UPI00131C2504|nr:DUF1080 domain-containing protein [Lunatibacter salilacus]